MMQALLIGLLTGPQWTVQVDPLTTALGFLHVQIERTLGDHASVYGGPNLHIFESPLAEPLDPITGLGLEVGVRWYFRGDAPKGAWGLTRGVVAHLSAQPEGKPSQATIGGYVSLLGGYTWILAEWLVLSAGGGVQYLAYEVAGEGTAGIRPAAHTTVGVAF